MEFSGWSPYPLEVKSADLTPMGEGRPEGLHLGTVLKQVKKAAGETYRDIPGEQEGVRIQVGFLWETAVEYMAAGLSLDDALDTAFKRLMVHSHSLATQVQVKKDGILMTPDAFDPGRGHLLSFKATWRSFAKAKSKEDFESNFWTWIMQEASYAYALGVDSATWVVLWVCGDYSGPKSPKVMQATVRWTAEELTENWRIVLQHAKSLDSTAAES